MKSKLIITVLITVIVFLWPLHTQASPRPHVVAEVCIVAALALICVGGCAVYHAVCKLQKNIDKQQSDPDNPPAPNTNAPQKKLDFVVDGQQPALTLMPSDNGEQNLSANSGWIVTDISSYSSTNSRLVDPIIGQPYTIWSRSTVVSSTNACSWNTNATSVELKIEMWVSCAGNSLSAYPPMTTSLLVVISGRGVQSATNYYQCVNQNLYGYNDSLAHGSFSDVISTNMTMVDQSVPQKYFRLLAQ